jgi:aminopeptidase YwaD
MRLVGGAARGWRMLVRTVIGVIAGFLLTGGLAVRAQKPPLLPERDVAALANELSGETAKRNLEGIARFHRQRGSSGFHSAAELVAERLRSYGLSDVAILQFPTDGKIFYGTQRSRPAWDAQVGELEELTTEHQGETTGDSAGKAPADAGHEQDYPVRLASYEAEPVVLAEDSESAEVTAELLDVGEGTRDSNYQGKDAKGKIVLAAAQPGAVQDLAVGKYGAVGIISYAQNQKTAWSGENDDLIRWGHLETFSANKTFAFMVSLKTARSLEARMLSGEKIKLHATVQAGQRPGNYEVVTATIPGADAKLKEEEIAFSCHLDHQRPGANDNASGCATILEVARTLEKLIDEKKLDRPARTIRFIFPPEVEGTMALLNSIGSIASPVPASSELKKITPGPDLRHSIKAVVHMDMVGGGAETKAVFHVTRGPLSLPSFVHDVAWAFAEWVNGESYRFAATGSAAYAMVAPEGGKEPLRAEYSPFSMGSDHEVYQDSSFKIPAIYLNDWPDRYIHTNFDSAANIDPTKLKRAAFIGGASAYFLAGVHDGSLPAIYQLLQTGSLRIAAEIRQKAAQTTGPCAGGEIQRFEAAQIRPLVESVTRFTPDAQQSRWAAISRIGQKVAGNSDGMCLRTELVSTGVPVYRRKADVQGPLTVFGYDYFAERSKVSGVPAPKLLQYEGLWGSGEEYAYEILNFADGRNRALEICDAVSAEYGPVPLELVAEYLEALEKAGVVEAVKQ